MTNEGESARRTMTNGDY